MKLVSRWAVVFIVVGLLAPLSLAGPPPTIMLEMTDGTKLATDYYLPAEGGPAWPVVVARSTYAKALARDQAERYNKRGYACVVQDTRGLGFSKGEKNVFYTDGWRAGLRDGTDTIAWVKSQPWCNGKIGTVGGSALGMTQVLMAPVVTDVVCQTIEVAPSNFYHNVAYQGGVWRKNLVEGWLTMLGLQTTMAIYKSHPTYDTFWTYYNVEAKAPEIHLPGMHIGGWYDIFQQGTINNFVTRQNQGGPGAKGNQKLIMRWSSHGKDDERDFKFNKNRHDVRIAQLKADFEDYWLKGVDNGIMDSPAVYYYVMGDDTDPDAPGMEWRTADTWPPFPTTATPYYFAPDGLLLTEAGTEPATASFTYDPADPVLTHGGANLLRPAGPFDQRAVSEGRTDILKFATSPLAAPVESTGRVTVKLYVSTDAPDTDFTAKLLDIYPAGDDREIIIVDGIQRVKFRNGYDKPAPLLTSSEEVVEISLDLWSTSWIFNTNHRIGVDVSSSNYPRFEKNANTGEDFPDPNNLRVAHNTVHLGKGYSSALILPIPE